MVFSNRINDSSLDTGRMFDEFYTTDISRTKGNTGLGLAIVKQFSQLLGGSIQAQVKSEELSITILFSKSTMV